MTSPKESQEPLRMRRVFAAPRERVWAAWTQREQLEQWMCRDVPTHDPKYAELDVRPGGRYVMEIPLPNGKYIGRGEFREVRPPERLVFTWVWQRVPEKPGEDLGGESLVTVELIDRGGQTEMVFTHEGLVSRQEREATHTGWLGCFDVLGRVLEGLHV
ncbi:MAG: SRPBCC family protein [Bryobacteraceae bacterium]